jgi:ABC-type multidrug transport system permease subunit
MGSSYHKYFSCRRRPNNYGCSSYYSRNEYVMVKISATLLAITIQWIFIVMFCSFFGLWVGALIWTVINVCLHNYLNESDK